MRNVIGLLPGHSKMASLMLWVSISPDPFCRGCHLEEETSWHILCESEVNSALRFEYFAYYILDPSELQDISEGCLLNFALATGLLS